MVPKILVEVKADACPPVNEAISGTGAPQLYLVALGIILLPAAVGVNTKVVPEHIVVLMLAIEGFGLT